MTSFSQEQLNAIQRTVKDWPIEKSVKRASEELMELALALMHYERNKVGIHAVLSEMADVRIALQHLEFQLGDYQAHLNEKVIKGNR